MAKMPLVSIVVPVYNGETLLPIALDSIVNQTYKNIEVIAVNNSSTDRTLEILEEYARSYPQIKIYTIPPEQHKKVPGGSKRYGYGMAKGEYIACCDADDRMHFRAIEWLVETALEDDYDLVVAPCYEITGGEIKLINQVQSTSKEDLILNSNVAFWTKLIKRDFYLNHDPICDEYPFDDFIYHVSVLPSAQKIGYCPNPVYYYYRLGQDRTDDAFIEKMYFIFDSCSYILANKLYHDYQASFFLTIKWLVGSINARWLTADRAIEEIKKYWPQIQDAEEYFKTKSTRIYQLAKLYAQLPDEPMPRTVYINGFGVKKETLEERITQLRKQALYGGCQVLVLDEVSCDLSENELVHRAYKAENWDFIGGYFALKKIYENGGVYLHRRIKLEAPLNYVRYFRSFFCRLSENSYSDSIFGGMAGNEIFKSILDTYTETFYPDPFWPLAERINNILISKYRVPMKNDTAIFKYATVVLAPSVTMFPSDKGVGFRKPLHLCYHDFLDQAGGPGYCTLPIPLLQANTSVSACNQPELRRKAGIHDRYDRHFKELKKWQRGVVLYFMDRGIFKEKAKKNLAAYPLIYRIARAAYRLIHKGESKQ